MQVQGYYQNIYNYFIKLLLKCECIYFKVFFFSFHSSVMFFQNTWFCKIRCKGNWLEKVEVDVSEMCLFFYERTKFCEFKLETKNIHFWQRSLPRFYGSTSCKVFIQVRNKYKLTKTSTVKLRVVDCTEVYFTSFLSGGFITAIEVNLPERKLAKGTSVQCTIGRGGSKQNGVSMHATDYGNYVSKYLLQWKKTRANSGNVRNNVF